MSMEKVRDFFGVKYLIPYNLTTFQPLVVLRALGDVMYENQVKSVDLVGGDAEAPYDVEWGQPSPQLKGTVREYPSQIFSLMEAATVTLGSAEVSGSVTTMTNAQGTSIFNTPGITNVTTNPALLASLPFGRLTFVATGAQTLDCYLNGQAPSGDAEYLNTGGLVVTGISTTTTGSVQISALGLVLTITGVPNYNIGDTFTCHIRPVSTGYTKVTVGGGTYPTNFGVRCVFPRKSDGVLHYIDIFNVAARGISWNAKSRTFSEFSIDWKPLVRSSDGAVYEMVRVLGQ